MTKLVTPILLVIISIGLFFTYLRPAYDVLLAFQAQEKELDKAIQDSKTLLEIHNELLNDYMDISSEDRARLDTILPQEADIVRLILDIDALATKHNLTIDAFELPDLDSGSGKNARAKPGDEDPIGSAILTVECTGEYHNFKAFLLEVEHSLALMDAVSIEISVPEVTKAGTGQITYTLGLQTYWVK